jgi:CDGSH iron-sulfur domain-containing protein 3
MSEPTIADRKPIAVKLEAGTYYWCACGRSGKQPFCDGAHKGTGFVPLKFEVTEPSTQHLCMCKHTNNKPYCDGAHHHLK